MILSVKVVKQRHAGKREVAAAPRELLESPAAFRWPGWQPQLDDQFVRAKGGAQRALEEIVRSNCARTRSTEHLDLAAASDRDAGQFRRRIGMSETPADRAFVPDHIMCDMRSGGDEQRMRG